MHAPMYAPMPEDTPDPRRPGWVPPGSPPSHASHPSLSSLPPYTVYESYRAPGLPPSPGYRFPNATPRRTSSDAGVSLVCGIAGWFLVPVICPILAIIFAVRAKRAIRASAGALDGVGMANAGLMLGIVSLVVTVIAALVVFLLFVAFAVAIASG